MVLKLEKEEEEENWLMVKFLVHGRLHWSSRSECTARGVPSCWSGYRNCFSFFSPFFVLSGCTLTLTPHSMLKIDQENDVIAKIFPRLDS